jgi:hypothetical protein
MWRARRTGLGAVVDRRDELCIGVTEARDSFTFEFLGMVAVAVI